MRKNLKTLAWVGVGLLVAGYLSSFLIYVLSAPNVASNDFYWLAMALIDFTSTAGVATGAVFLAGALLIHFGLDRRSPVVDPMDEE